MKSNKNIILDYFKENNELVERLTIKNKILYRLIAFIICSICYPLFTLSKRYNTIYGDEISSSSIIEYIHIIMIICYIISTIGVIYILISLIFPNFINKFNSKIKFGVKKGIFNILDWGIILPICACVAVFFYSFIFIITPISGTSMYPTIEDGSNILVSYLDKVEQFDVIVFEVNEHDNFNVSSKSYYIKRVIGMPGDRVKWVDKKLYINDELIDETYLPSDYLSSFGFSEDFDSLHKYKNDLGEEVITNVIPEGYYFVMGDNRTINGSKDSRKIGLIKEENVIGVAKYFMNLIIPSGKVE